MLQDLLRPARAAVARAATCAVRRGDEHVGTQHLLAGLAAARTGAVASLLAPHGVTAARVAAALDGVDDRAHVAVGAPPPRTGGSSGRGAGRRRGIDTDLPLTTGARTCLENARREAAERGARHVGPEHVLLSVCSFRDHDPAVRVLAQLGVDVDVLRSDVTVRLDPTAPEGA